ncbi:MAG: BTAD domain-containing putative transcriptional regulator [Gemmatimonadota bacterium]
MTGPAVLRLNPALVASDVAEFREAMLRGDADTAVALYTGPFLDGFFIRDADTFERWAAATRATLAVQYAEALETLAERAGSRGDSRGAVEWWRRRQSADPFSGRVAVGLMRALDAAGDRAGALRHAQVHDALLRQEIGEGAADPLVAELAATLSQPQPATSGPASPVKPSPEPRDVASPLPDAVADARSDAMPLAMPIAMRDATPEATPPVRTRRARRFAVATALVAVAVLAVWALGRDRDGERDAVAADGQAQAMTTADGATSRTQSRPAVPRPSVAVLPFANTSGDAADEPFADGLTDELIGALGQVAGLKVAPRTSTFALKGKGLDLRTVAETLGVATALEGSVRRAGDQLRVTVALVDAAENRVLWSETYDRKLADVFAVQGEIARAVVGALKLTLAPTPASNAVLPPTRDLVAYELYLKGQFFRYQLNGVSLRRAVEFFEGAIARDPRYARAYSGLADAQALLVLFGDRPPREGFRRARASAMKALALDSTLAQAHASLAHIEMAHDWNWDASGPRYQRANALDPASTTIRLWRGLWLFDQRRFDEAAALLEETLASDPLSTPVRLTLGRMYVSMHQPDRALPYLRGTLELNPQLAFAHQQLGHALLQKNLQSDAIAAFERAAALSGMRDSAQLAYGYAVTGRREAATAIVQAVLRSQSRRYISPFDMAVAYTGLGDVDEAFRWLERAFEEHAAGMDTIAITPAFEPLHADPRWSRLLRRMGLPQ